jgi:hypothetical protein
LIAFWNHHALRVWNRELAGWLGVANLNEAARSGPDRSLVDNGELTELRIQRDLRKLPFGRCSYDEPTQPIAGET